ncbi:MAG: TolC family protein [Saprospiraceae bacterium]|nr:TolC family protein [Saprospiraceae bacterium]
MIKDILFILLGLLGTVSLVAQDSLSLEQVIDLGLKHNYGLKLTEQNIEISKNTATIGNAGFLPTTYISGQYQYSLNNTSQEFANGIPPADVNGASSHAFGANLGVDYVIFNGLKPKYTLQKYKNNVELNEKRYDQQAEQLVYTLITSYYDLASLQEDFRILEEKMAFTKVQIKRIEARQKFGQGSEVERLNLLTSYNTDSIQGLRLKLNMEQLVYQLNRLIGQADISVNTVVKANTDLDLSITYEALLEAAKANNPSLQQTKLNIIQADNDIKLAKADYYPTVNANITYGYNGQKNEVGILLENNNLGLTAGLGLRYNFYNGGRVKTNVKNAKLGKKMQEMQLEQQNYELEQDLKNAFTVYQNNIALIQIEESNLELNKKTFDRTVKAYQLGKGTYLQYQQAELALTQAKYSVTRARFAAKQSEWALLQFTGILVK